MFCGDYPRGLVNCLWLRWFPVFDAFPVAPGRFQPAPAEVPQHPEGISLPNRGVDGSQQGIIVAADGFVGHPPTAVRVALSESTSTSPASEL